MQFNVEQDLYIKALHAHYIYSPVERDWTTKQSLYRFTVGYTRH